MPHLRFPNSFHFAPVLTRVVVVAISMVITAAIAQPAHAQKADVVYRFPTAPGAKKVSGKITDMSADSVVIQTRSEPKTIPASEIRRIVYGGEASALDRIRQRIKAGNFERGLEDLPDIETKDNPYVIHEIAYLTALAKANLAMAGSVPLEEAGSAVNDFLKKYQKSYHFFPATELKGKLLMALGKLDLATAEFQQLAQSSWDRYQITGGYLLAQSLCISGRYQTAIEQCNAIIDSSNNDDLTQRYQLLAKCLKAKSQSLSGSPGTAEADVNAIIKVEDPSNQELFAAAYNALGVYHFQANRLKEAREKFLLTHLLMYNQQEYHAESLYYLSQIWPKLDDNAEGNKVRSLLKSRYRNSYWAKQLN